MPDWNAGVYLGSVPWSRFLLPTSVTVTTTATALPATAAPGRKGVWIWNTRTVNLYFGGSGVLAAAPHPYLVPIVGNIWIPASDAVTIYGIVAAASQVILVWECA